MIYNDGNSELHIRLHIAELLKDKVEQDNFDDLCNKMLRFVMNGITLPKVKKNPMEEVAEMLSKLTIEGLDELEKAKMLPPKTHRDELKELYEKHKAEMVSVKNHACSICGYSPEFDCLIAGTDEICDDGVKCGDNDIIRMYYYHYFYVSKDAVEKQ